MSLFNEVSREVGYEIESGRNLVADGDMGNELNREKR